MEGVASKTVNDVDLALNNFKRILRDEIQKEIILSPQYRMVGNQGAEPHWPASYKSVWRKEPGNGVYIIFDESDHVIYVGKSVCIGTRLAAYFAYDDAELPDQPKSKKCKIIDSAIRDASGVSVRAVVLSESREIRSPLDALGPALEAYLIAHLDPPVNKNGRVSRDS